MAGIEGKKILKDDVFTRWKELNDLMEKSIKLIDANVEAAKDLNKQLSSGDVKKYNKAIKQTAKNTDDLTDEQKKLNSIQRQNNALTQKTALEQAKLAKRRKEARLEAEKELGIAKKRKTLFGQMTKAILAAGAAYLSINAASTLFNKIIGSTSRSIDKFNIRMQAARNATNVFFKALASGDFRNLGKRMREAAEAGREYARALIDIRNSQRALNILQAETNKSIERLKIISDDATRSFEERTEAANNLIEERNALLSKQERLAQKTFDAELKNIAAVTSANEDQIKSFIRTFEVTDNLTKQTEEYIEAQKVLRKNNNRLLSEFGPYAGAAIQTNRAIIAGRKVVADASDEVKIYADVLRGVGKSAPQELDKISDSWVKLLEVQQQQQTFEAESSKIIGQLKQDQLERELDFIIDVADARKTVIERQLTDENLIESQRRGLIQQMANVLNESFTQQIGIIEKFTDAQLDVNKLIKLNNEDSIKYVRTLGLSEIIEGRVLEIIRERIFAMQDLRDVTKDFNDTVLKDQREELEFLNKEWEKYAKNAEAAGAEFEKLADQMPASLQKIRDEGLLPFQKESTDTVKGLKALTEEELTDFKNFLAHSAIESFNFADALFDRELQNVEEGFARRIQAAEGNAEEQERIEKERAKKVAEIERKQAIVRKAQGVTESLINTAVAVTKLLPTPPLAIAAGVLGALQTATILAQTIPPIPAFEKGTGRKGAPGGFALVGEKRHELGILPSGQMFITPNTPTIMDIPPRTIIEPNLDSLNNIVNSQSVRVENKSILPKEINILLHHENGVERKQIRTKYRGGR